MNNRVTFVREAVIIPLAQMNFTPTGLEEVEKYIEKTSPELGPTRIAQTIYKRENTSNSELVEFAGRLCYRAFGNAASNKSNAEYIANIQAHKHTSVQYHAKMSFFFADISRALSHELIRHYVGADRDEEGSVSQESTRYVKHNGRFRVHPNLKLSENIEWAFEEQYENYLNYIKMEETSWVLSQIGANGRVPMAIRKKIHEAAATLLPMAACTSFVWTTNPVALSKMIFERKHETANMEFQEFALKLEKICVRYWPNLFQQHAQPPLGYTR